MLAPTAKRGHECQAQRDQFEDRINRQLHPLPIDQNPAADDFIKPTGLDRQEYTIDRQKRKERKGAEDNGLQIKPGPEH